MKGRVTFYDEYNPAYVYQFKLPNGQLSVARVLFETDEFIASATATPHQRLIAAIQQNCSYQHLEFLVKTFSIDITKVPIRDSFSSLANGNGRLKFNALKEILPSRNMLLSKAIQNTSYNGLLFLRKNLIKARESERDPRQER